MLEERSEAQRWEDGCHTDGIRNQFIIPEIARIFETARPMAILDVGAGTGYVARGINERLSYAPRWTMVDTCAARVELAGSLKPTVMIQDVIEGDVLSLSITSQPFDAVLVTFTLLEIADVEACASKLWSLMSPDGIVVVALPDAWSDVLTAAADNPALVHRFLNERVSLPKHDKFTGNPYPFDVIRLESLIDIVLRAGFFLEEIKRSESSLAGVFLLTFRHRPALKA